jgi:hypothetical protein
LNTFIIFVKILILYGDYLPISSKIEKLLTPKTQSIVEYCIEKLHLEDDESFEGGEFIVDAVSGISNLNPNVQKQFRFIDPDSHSGAIVLTSKRIIFLCKHRKTGEVQTCIRPVAMVENATFKQEGSIIKTTPLRIHINGTNYSIFAGGGEIPEEFAVNVNKYAKLNRNTHISNDSSKTFELKGDDIFCIKCGTKLPQDANYCFKCGVKVEN